MPATAAPSIPALSRARTFELSLTGNALPLSPTGDPPVNFTLIRKGELTTVYGTFLWTDRSARECAAAWAARSRRFMWDYEHLSTRTVIRDRDGEKIVVPPKLRESAGDADAMPDAEGFHLRDQKWTDAGAVRSRKWLYFSPVIVADEETREILDVIKSALTNDPATLSCPPLTLSEDGGFEERRVGLGGPVRHDPQAFETVDSPDWDETSAVKRIWEWAGTVDVDGRKVPDFARARLAFALVRGSGAKREDYLLPHHDVVGAGQGAKLVTIRGGVQAAGRELARMGPALGVSAADIEGAREHLTAEAARFGDALGVVAESGQDEGLRASEGASGESAQSSNSKPELNDDGEVEEEMSTDSNKAKLPKAANDSANHSAELAQPAMPQIDPHPHGNPAKVEVSAVLCTLDDGRTMWGKRRDSGKYTTPGGRLKRGERPIDAAARELKEETGLTVAPHSLAYLGTVRCTGKAGELIDVHGYKAHLTDAVEPTTAKDPEQEVEAWEWMAEHPHGMTHVPRNALSVLSAKLPMSMPSAAQADPDKAQVQQELSTMSTTPNQQDEIAKLRAELAEVQRVASEAKAKASESERVISQVRELSGVDLTKPGAMGQLLTMRDASERAQSAVELSEDQRKGALIEQAFKTGRISQKTRIDCKNKVRELSVVDCEHMVKGPKIYDAPSELAAPQAETAVTATPPESVLPRETVELTAHEKAAVASAQAQGIRISEETVLAHKRKQANVPAALRAPNTPNPGNN